ncbi:MAG: T9SS type A sorting domain-containing protein [Bacteroidota bacterium]|nr:T9SS type A sorting domain-containing protein [Bacteroidota bacterium]
MKKIITLLSVTFIAVSFMGQNVKLKSDISDFRKVSGIGRVCHNAIVPENRPDLLFYNSQKVIQMTLMLQKDKYLQEKAVSKQQLDSVVLQTLNKPTTNFVDSTKDEFAYDAKGRNILYINYSWNVTTKKWVGQSKDEITYDINGNLTQEIYYDWNSSSKNWVANEKFEYTFDVTGNMIRMINYSWDPVAGSFVANSKFESTYNANRNLTLQTNYNWDATTSLWVNASKIEYTYNTNGSESQHIFYLWEGTTFTAFQKTVKTYDTSGRNTLVVDSQWDFVGNKWVNSSESQYVYDTNGNLTLDGYYTWNVATNQWVGDNQDGYAYDSNGNVTTDTQYTWNSVTQQWVNTLKSEYVFDYNYSSQDLILANMYLYQGLKNKLTFVNVSKYEGGNWNLSQKYTLYYSAQIPSAIETVHAGTISIYPNPVTNYVTFNIDKYGGSFTLELLDLQGKRLQYKLIQNNSPVLLETVQSGLYLYRITADNKVYNGKLMIK